MKKQTWVFIGLTYFVPWSIWITAHLLGAGAGVGEYILAFGASGLALVAVFLSRHGQGDVAVHSLSALFGSQHCGC
jgi:hypothetical protein